MSFDFVFTGQHLHVMRRRRQWFQRAVEPMTALWWVPAGYRPSTDDAEQRIRHLRRHGPTAESFTLRTPFPSPAEPDAEVPVGDGWHCPA